MSGVRAAAWGMFGALYKNGEKTMSRLLLSIVMLLALLPLPLAGQSAGAQAICGQAAFPLTCSPSLGTVGSGGGFPAASTTSERLCVSSLPPDMLIVTRDSVGKVPSFLMNTRPFTRLSRAGPAIKRLYRVVCSLRPPARDRTGRPFVLTCNSWPVEVHLVFLHRGHRELRLTAATGGCPVVARASHVFRGARLFFTGRVHLWALIARAVGVQKAALLPYPAHRR